jgi:hypothetical protein
MIEDGAVTLVMAERGLSILFTKKEWQQFATAVSLTIYK